jgi:hypothetical protein
MASAALSGFIVALSATHQQGCGQSRRQIDGEVTVEQGDFQERAQALADGVLARSGRTIQKNYEHGMRSL